MIDPIVSLSPLQTGHGVYIDSLLSADPVMEKPSQLVTFASQEDLLEPKDSISFIKLARGHKSEGDFRNSMKKVNSPAPEIIAAPVRRSTVIGETSEITPARRAFFVHVI